LTEKIREITVCGKTRNFLSPKFFPWNQFFSKNVALTNFLSKMRKITVQCGNFKSYPPRFFCKNFVKVTLMLKTLMLKWKSTIKRDHLFYEKINIFFRQINGFTIAAYWSYYRVDFTEIFWAWSRFILLFHTVLWKSYTVNWFHEKFFKWMEVNFRHYHTHTVWE